MLNCFVQIVLWIFVLVSIISTATMEVVQNPRDPVPISHLFKIARFDNPQPAALLRLFY
ncbi:uncharacterized protein V1513DRAFT_411418 [Lipomyces chichibuensis]|uniref:uncharacterized protein n=1 Tax=Lipomyces chichibuensis TaxID=1546026 RepID=UPI003343454B